MPDNLVWPQQGDPNCTDLDGDGFGPGCALGDDCDDGTDELVDECDQCDSDHRTGCRCTVGQDPNEQFYTGPDGTLGQGVCRGGVRTCTDGRWTVLQPERGPNAGEICGNNLDDDCDGEIDENVFECADCNPSCHTGGGSDGLWNDDPADRDGIVELPDGGLTLREDRREFTYAWIANDGESTVSKFNTRTSLEEARYRTGLPGIVANRPSRTAVDRNGDVYIANRAFDEQGSVTKIAGTPDACVDRNGNGAIETSTGPGDVLAYGDDECIIWTVPLSGINAVPRSLAIDTGDDDVPQGYPWIGTFNDTDQGSLRHGRAFKLDPSDGRVLFSVALPLQPYGAIASASSHVWFTAWGNNALAFVSTEDGSVSGAIPKTEPFGCNQTYGIARDEHGDLWMGGWSCECAYRYAPVSGEWTTIDLRGRGNTRGVAPDGEGNVWIAHSTNPGKLSRVPIDAPVVGGVIATDQTELVTLQGDATGTVGVGADFERHLWLVNRDSSTVTRMDLANRDQQVLPGGLAPYTYSDFTGFQLLSKLTPEGHYEQDFEGCEPGNDLDPNVTEWGDLTWQADVPASTFLQFVVQTADTEVGLAAAQQIIVATLPPDQPPAKIGALLADAGVEPGRYLRVTVRFISQDGVSRPILYRMSLTWICPDFIG